jgi:hypothetical protein
MGGWRGDTVAHGMWRMSAPGEADDNSGLGREALEVEPVRTGLVTPRGIALPWRAHASGGAMPKTVLHGRRGSVGNGRVAVGRHTLFLCQNQVLIICMTQDPLFHTYGPKVFTNNQMP